MGVGYSNSLAHFQNEVDSKFLRPLEASVQSQRSLCGLSFEERARKILFTYPSLLLLNFMDGMSVDLGHLAVLFVLDSDKDGLFSWQDISSFLEWIHTTIPTDEKDLGSAFSEAVHARCVLQMWRECIGLSGSDGFEIPLHAEGRSDVDAAASAASSTALADVGGRGGSSRGQAASGSIDGGLLPGESDREVFEEWFERFLSKNFPFTSDRQHQAAPMSVSEAAAFGSGSSGGARSSRRVSSSSAHCALISAPYSSLVVDAAGVDAIAVCEVSPFELRQRAKSFSLSAISAAHVLLAVEENYALDLRSFCATLVGDENLRRQGRDFACPARALRAFNAAFIDSYWAGLRRFDLQPLL